MLIACGLQDLNFDALMEVYVEGNISNGRERYPTYSEIEQIRLAELDFHRYLAEDFFAHSEARYYVFTEEDKYIAAVRMEPYKDGLLLQALETRPDMRKRGYAKKLIDDALAYVKKCGYCRVYSHVSKRNTPSLKVHLSSGFVQICDYAAYIDGTVTTNALTLCIEI